MVKKKKNRQPQEPTQNAGDSTESGDENQTTNTTSVPENKCPHVQKAVDLSKVKKALKTVKLASECPQCVKEGLSNENNELDSNPGLWLCLKCGHQGCGRTRRQHALKHFTIVHSDPHCLVVNTELWNVWCYECKVELDSTYRKKLHECIKYLKQDDHIPVAKTKLSSRITEEEEEGYQELQQPGGGNTDVGGMPLTDLTNIDYNTVHPKRKVPTPTLPRVRGLSNLGNTCFFNAVLQCLAQTPFLLDLLYEMKEPGMKFHLPGGKGMIPNKEDEELPVLEGELGKWGVLTETLASILSELQADNACVVNPSRLLKKLTQRCPQFDGGDQHDSHELLRHLLEEVRCEDLKRYWTVILKKYGLSRYDTNDTVDEDLRAKVKAYGRQASEQLLYPEQAFRGILVSTLECQDCLHSYQHVETFYELSLPVTANKPQPPVMRRKSSNEDCFDICGKPTNDAPSKHQLKKERKQQRKNRKRQRGSRILDLVNGEPPIVEETAGQNSGESEQSDADVEDNLEQEVVLKEQNKYIVESGYSSEKAGNEDSAVASPVSTVNGDSVLASPDPLASKELDMSSDSVYSSTLMPCSGDSEAVDSCRLLDRSHLCLPLTQNLKSEDSISDLKCVETSEELSISIPSLTCPPLPLCSPVSNTGSPSPVSSETNIDLHTANNSSQTDCNGLGSGERNEDTDRPYSRIAFCNETESGNTSMESPKVPCIFSDNIINTNESIEIKDVASSNLLVKEIGELSLSQDDRQSPSHWDTCSAHSLEDIKELKTAVVQGDPVCNGDFAHSDMKLETSPAQEVTGATVDSAGSDKGDKSATLAPRYHCEDGECSVETCLNQFTVLELMTGNNKVYCKNCSERINQGKDGKMVATNSTKQYLVSSPPAVLVLHFKRFEVHQNMFRKTPRHVTFPMVLDIAPICSVKCKELPTVRHNQTKILYSLYGVVQHIGNIHAGHYTAYVKVRAPVKQDDIRWSFLPTSEMRRNLKEDCSDSDFKDQPVPGKWYHVSDTKVNEVNEERVLRSQAYLLFYERIW